MAFFERNLLQPSGYANITMKINVGKTIAK